MKPLPKQYDHQTREKHWQEHWVREGTYHFADDKPRDETFVIDTPPPTVSGLLHMGHIFSYTQADFIARYQRMAGKDVFYPMGFDDNGLPTERLVEKIKDKKASGYATREEFIAVCREVVIDAENAFRKLFKSAALSVDWRKEYQTINDDVQKLSQSSFIDLLKKNEAYRDFRPTYWDWVDQTAIAQAEIENKELPGTMNEIEFTLEGGAPLVIMTTRPELLGACVAVMYHPEDPNAGKYAGKHAITPLFGVKVPMIADEAVEREKGTGLVMCCTFGDDTDKEWARIHELAWRPILGLDGKFHFTILPTTDNKIDSINFNAGKLGSKKYGDLSLPINRRNCVDLFKTQEIFEQIKGLKPKQAQAKTIELLQAAGKLLKQTPMTHTVKCAERSGTPIEIIPTHQWFVRITDKKEALLAKGAEVNWHPEYMRIRLNQWIEGLKEDWCISRQRFFGVPFPVWYELNIDPVDNQPLKIIYASNEQLPVDPLIDSPAGYKKIPDSEAGFKISGDLHGKIHINPAGKMVALFPDKDVMDTWATSSISPQINAQTLSTNKLFPADLRPQAHEIIRTWAFYTIAKAHLHTNTVPWKNIMISGWCLAADKTKMSKSKDNVVTPVALIEEKGTDAVRYWASTSRLGTDTAFSEDLLKIGRKLVNKLWNASQFASLNLDKLQPGAKATEALDIWILSRLNQCIKKATEQFEIFEYCDARVAIEDFFWNDFCDNYLELVKARAYGESAGDQQSALFAISQCLDALLRLFAPFVPHITEELYSNLFEDTYRGYGSIHARGMWPKAENYAYDAQAERAGQAAVDILNVIRKAKSEASVSIKAPVAEVYIAANDGAPNWASVEADIKAAGNAARITASQDGEFPYVSDRGWYRIRVVLAKIEEQKLDEKQSIKNHGRNPDQGPHETLDAANVLHGAGSPDLSKHAVKVQVDRVPESLQRQK